MEDEQLLDRDFNSEYDKKTIELISTNKFIILCVLSFGLYTIWWFYKSWKFFKEKENLDIMPVARAIFAIFFTYSLFEEIKKFAIINGYTNNYSSGLLFTLYVLINILSNLPDPFWLISILAFFCLIQPFEALNFAIQNSDEYNGVEREGFNSRQIAVLVIGGIFFFLVIYGLMMPTDSI